MAVIADVKAFDVEFNNAVEQIGASEKITKSLLKVYASLAVQAVHQFQNPAYLNKLRAALTPVNKKVFTEFALYYAGYSFDKDAQAFTTKSKKRYIEAKARWDAFCEDPLNNIWKWAETSIQVERKPLNVQALNDSFQRTWRAAHKANISNVDVLKAMLSVKDGDKGIVFSAQDIAEALQAMNDQAPIAAEKVALPENMWPLKEVEAPAA